MQPQNPAQPTNGQSSDPDPLNDGHSNATQPSILVNRGKVIQPISENLVPSTSSSPSEEIQSSPVVQPSTSLPVDTTLAAGTDQNQLAPQPTDTLVGLTGSQIPEEKIRLPKGVYFIAAFDVVGCIAGFLNTYQTNAIYGAIYTCVMVLNLLVGVGLLFRLELARKITIWLSGLVLILTVANVLLVVVAQQSLQYDKAKYDTAVGRLDKNTLTTTQKQQLAAMQSAVNADVKQAGKAFTFTYTKLGVTALESIIVIVYLTRPKVAGVFRDLEA